MLDVRTRGGRSDVCCSIKLCDVQLHSDPSCPVCSTALNTTLHSTGRVNYVGCHSAALIDLV